MISDEILKKIARGDIHEATPDDCINLAQELMALRKANEGWQLVPVEPTQEMLKEIWLDERFKELAMKRRYQAMLAASPTPPQ